MRCRRLAAAMAALVMTMAFLFSSVAAAEGLENVIVLSAPLKKSSTVRDGMVRVWLKSIGDVTALDVTVTGNYSVNGNTAMSLSTGDQVKIGFDKATGSITMTMNGLTYAMGKEMRLRRHQANGNSAVSIAQANSASNLYPGDLQLLAVENNGAYRLYPIVHVYLEYYLKGVVPYEMGSSFPLEALKAQAVASRTYVLREMAVSGGDRYDVNDTSSFQVYRGMSASANNATRAVDATQGIVVQHGSSLTGSFYTASNGGQTEASRNVWGGTGYAYLKVKEDPFDAANTYSSRRRATIYTDFDQAGQNANLAELLSEAAKAQLGDTAVIQTINSVVPHTPKYAAPSRLYTLIDFGVTVLADGETVDTTLTFSIFDDLESKLGMSIQSSDNELWTVEKLSGGFRVTAARAGHGIGMSQRGAQKMAQMGYTYDQILGFYYEGCDRVQYTFAHTILPAGSSNDIVSTEPPAEISPAVPDQATVTLPGAGDIIPLRYTASAEGKTLTGVPNGAGVTVLAKAAEWTMVRYGEIIGYLPTDNLTFNGVPPTTSDEKPTAISFWAKVSGTNSLNFREGPSFDDNVIQTLSEGEVLCVLSTTGEWVRVQFGAKVGYVSKDYLTYYQSYPGSINADTSAMVSLEDVSYTVSLLAAPSMSATAIMELQHGTQVTVLSNDGSWCRVEVAGVEGYLLNSSLDFGATGVTPTDAPDAEEMTAIVNSTASTLNLRSGPGEAYSVTAEIPKGTEIVVTERGETWCAVRWGSLTGYVMTKYLLFGDEDPTPTPTQTTESEPTNTPAPVEPEGRTAWVMKTVNYVNLRKSASTEAEVITRIPSGDELIVLEEKGTFSYVKHGVGTGYVLARHLTYTKPLPSIGILYVNTDVDPLSMRDEADLYDSVILTRIPRGEAVMLIEREGDWSYVQYGDYIGYCASQYLSYKKPTNYAVDDIPIYDPTMQAVTGWTALNNTSEALPVYKWCSYEAPELTKIPAGGSMKLLQTGDIWCQISYEGEKGYCLTTKLVLLAP
ncbi:MAG: SH3 domain-containing protein [Clostridia bacterium]|nr:SH3 domain-containing protein [Clostridia bacterium]